MDNFLLDLNILSEEIIIMIYETFIKQNCVQCCLDNQDKDPRYTIYLDILCNVLFPCGMETLFSLAGFLRRSRATISHF